MMSSDNHSSKRRVVFSAQADLFNLLSIYLFDYL